MSNCKKSIIIYSMRMAGYLMLNGFPLEEIKDSNKNKGLKVFYFEDTRKLRKFLDDNRGKKIT